MMLFSNEAEATDEPPSGRTRLALAPARLPDDGEPAPVSSEGVVESPQMLRLYEHIARASRANLPVLVVGETGVGKEHVASRLHREGDRRDGPFVVVNCAAVSPAQLEATLFGQEHERLRAAAEPSIGAFERANGGVLFLNEIGEVTAAGQAALLRAVETRHITRVGSTDGVAVDVRIVATTHCDLDAMVEEGSFRRDLYFRLAAVKLEVPPLRERTEDIEPLVHAFLEGARREWDIAPRTVSPEAMEALRLHPWPGNVRQLRHAVERSALLCGRDFIGVDDLPEYVRATPAGKGDAPGLVSRRSDVALREQVLRYERALIQEAVRRASGNRRIAAELLDIPLRTLFRKLRRR
jgi:DNA-binding NtrC family response regulator